jgi:hypothetical protein
MKARERERGKKEIIKERNRSINMQQCIDLNGQMKNGEQ